jgi:hypothetical protein
MVPKHRAIRFKAASEGYVLDPPTPSQQFELTMMAVAKLLEKEIHHPIDHVIQRNSDAMAAYGA